MLQNLQGSNPFRPFGPASFAHPVCALGALAPKGSPLRALGLTQNFPLLWEKPPELTEVPPPDFWVSIFTRVCVVVR